MELLEKIINDQKFAPYIVENRLIPARVGRFKPFPAGLDSRLTGALKEHGIEKLYTHQVQVFEQTEAGNNVVVVTPTASGKTLCYNLPVLNTLLRDVQSRALYLFPTKALSQDQQSELNETIGGFEGLDIKVATYDGDTPDSLRAAARDKGRIVITNPDMLHQGVLPNHTKWIKFFSELKYVVIDEAHTYRGVFGSHAANVIRRLKRIAAFYHSKPKFILCSATIANPQELCNSLIEEDVVLVDDCGAPASEKRVILFNPPLVDAVQGIRVSSVNESRRWMVTLLRAGIKTILFAHSRIQTEVAASLVNQDIANFYTNNSNIKVESYRGGLLPNERREIERGLRNGKIHGVVSTNALELGIDIGGLDASVVCGFPGSFNSFWQQAGRAGRRAGGSVCVFVASASPLDQFIMKNPEWFFRKTAEQACLDANNPYIYADHVKCGAFELPFDKSAAPELNPFGEQAFDVLQFLQEDGIVRYAPSKWYWSDRSFPAEGISLRSATAENIVIVDTTHGKNNVIGEMDRPSAKEMLFKNAVYIHRGAQYMVKDLDIANKKAFVIQTEVNYWTDGLVKADIKVLQDDEYFKHKTKFNSVLGDVLVRTQVTRFKKLKFRTNENIGFGEIVLPEEEMHTRAIILTFPDDTDCGGALRAMQDDEAAAACLQGVGTLIKNIAPMFLLCDSRDIGLAERIRDTHFAMPCLYIYDKYPGGAGLSESLAGRLPELFEAIYNAVAQCRCKDGCPSCLGPHGNKKTVLNFLKIASGVDDKGIHYEK
ncbi:putative ATP-dependent helicase YprA [Spirochaetia bacterium]|nr:putative ATP-dependent helicase YprA [Spirochaetia bacterium]